MSLSAAPLNTTPRILPRRAKIVCTIGPACNTEEGIRELMHAGMDVARLNFSHGTHEDKALIIARLRKVAAEEDRSICILQDLQGPKIRTGELEHHTPVRLEAGSEVTVTTRAVPGSATLVTTTYQALPSVVEAGSLILLSDGKLSLKVLSVENGEIHCIVMDGGLLAEHQGINLPGEVLGVPSLTPKDYEDLKFGLRQGVDVIAVSFVRSAKDVLELKRAIADQGCQTPVIAKLEKPQAIDNLEEILQATDGIMVARGDLGVEVAPERVPVIQKHVIRRAMELRKPVITATQMLESMIENPRPTRAEASDVANAIFDGTDAVMLSGETAAGKYPREAVAIMSRIIVEAEQHMLKSPTPHRRVVKLTISEALCESIAHIAEELSLRAIVVFSQSGTTARLISKYRPKAEVFAFTHIESVYNRMNQYWGIRPLLVPAQPSVEAMVRTAEEILLQRGLAAEGDVIGIVAGTLISAGTTDFIRLHTVHVPASADSLVSPL
jgi:pyruvate kinase